MAIVGAGGAPSAGRAVRDGADLVQVRAKHLSADELVVLVRAVIAEAGGPDQVIVNSRPDIAELTGALGVHLPETGLDSREVRRAYPRLMIGTSRHDRAGLDRAIDEEVDYVLLGPVFETPGKEAGVLGVALAAKILRGVALPVLAVGGVTVANARSAMESGFRGIAAIRPFRTECSAARDLRTALGSADEGFRM